MNIYYISKHIDKKRQDDRLVARQNLAAVLSPLPKSDPVSQKLLQIIESMKSKNR